MLVLLGFLLVALIKPYYRENRIKMIDTLVSTIENELLVNKPSEASILKTDRLVNNNNVVEGFIVLILWVSYVFLMSLLISMVMI